MKCYLVPEEISNVVDTIQYHGWSVSKVKTKKINSFRDIVQQENIHIEASLMFFISWNHGNEDDIDTD